MSKKFNLDISKINSKKVPAVAKVESIYNIDYEKLDISGIEKEKLIKYENDITFHKEKSMEHILNIQKQYLKPIKFLQTKEMDLLENG